MRRPAAALLAVVLSAGSAAAAGERVRLGGHVPLDPDLLASWCWSGAWTWPVGDPLDHARPEGDIPGYRLLRGVQRGSRPHEGVDLGNGLGGGPVRAAAHGIVVRVQPADRGGWGRHVVLAHRLAEGGVVYSVYAHLRAQDRWPRAGALVGEGEPIGRVGHSGRATGDHLHFEVRRANQLGERWERAAVVDPLAFVADRLPLERERDWAAAYGDWAAAGALLPRDADPGRALTREAWWRMLWRSTRHDQDVPPEELASLGEALLEAGVLPRDGARARAGAVTWAELARDLERVRGLGVRLPPVPAEPDSHRQACARELAPGLDGGRPGRRDASARGPTMEQAVLGLADIAGLLGR
jgi:hypothetical protein